MPSRPNSLMPWRAALCELDVDCCCQCTLCRLGFRCLVDDIDTRDRVRCSRRSCAIVEAAARSSRSIVARWISFVIAVVETLAIENDRDVWFGRRYIERRSDGRRHTLQLVDLRL